MIAWIISGILLVITILFGIRLRKKLIIDKSEINEYQTKIEALKFQKNSLNKDIEAQRDIIEKNNDEIKRTNTEIFEAQQKYNNEMRDRTQELDEYFNGLRAQRQSSLDIEFARKREEANHNLELEHDRVTRYYTDLENAAKTKVEEIERNKMAAIEESTKRIAVAQLHADEEQAKYEALLEPIRQYEKDRQERLFYTIQVPDEYKDDIDFLLTTVAAKVQHPDIINKLVYAEYVKPYLDDLFKRIDLKPEPGIYKITSLNDGKCYIGKSTNIKKRLTDHFKASVGLKSIAWQAVHDAILAQGYWNWTIEPIIYCSKDKLNEMEKYYIEFFKSNSFGFNKTGGGEG